MRSIFANAPHDENTHFSIHAYICMHVYIEDNELHVATQESASYEHMWLNLNLSSRGCVKWQNWGCNFANKPSQFESFFTPLLPLHTASTVTYEARSWQQPFHSSLPASLSTLCRPSSIEEEGEYCRGNKQTYAIIGRRWLATCCVWSVAARMWVNLGEFSANLPLLPKFCI